MSSNRELVFELQKVFGQLRRTNSLHHNHSKLKGAEKHILLLICELQRSQSVTISEIANNLGVTLAAVTHQIKTLGKQGLIRRSPSKDDRRVFVIELTKKGRTQVIKLKKEFAKKAQALAEFLGEKDTKDLIRLAKKMSKFTGLTKR